MPSSEPLDLFRRKLNEYCERVVFLTDLPVLDKLRTEAFICQQSKTSRNCLT